MSRDSIRLSTDKGRIMAVPEVVEQLRRSYWWLRKTFFTREKTDNPFLVVEMTKGEAQAFFGERHFEPGWEMSYSYQGEIVNLRRVEYAHVPAFPDLSWWQVHIRGYRHADPPGLELTAHFETEPAEHPSEHIGEVGIDVPRGNGIMRRLLDDAGIDYERSDDWTESPPGGSGADGTTSDTGDDVDHGGESTSAPETA